MTPKQQQNVTWALVMLLLGWVYALAQKVAYIDGRAAYFHGAPSQDEVNR